MAMQQKQSPIGIPGKLSSDVQVKGSVTFKFECTPHTEGVHECLQVFHQKLKFIQRPCGDLKKLFCWMVDLTPCFWSANVE
jgi:hypothetical protein